MPENWNGKEIFFQRDVTKMQDFTANSQEDVDGEDWSLKRSLPAVQAIWGV